MFRGIYSFLEIIKRNNSVHNLCTTDDVFDTLWFLDENNMNGDRQIERYTILKNPKLRPILRQNDRPHDNVTNVIITKPEINLQKVMRVWIVFA